MLARLCFFPYIGGKYNLLKTLAPLIPPHEIYVEVFGGAANLLLNKPPSPVEVYNDVDGEIVNLFLVVRDSPKDFVERSKPHCGGAQRKIPFPEIPAGRIIEREEALKILTDAASRLQQGGGTDETELIRFRTIIAAVRAYFTVSNSYEKYAELEERVRRLEADIGQIIKNGEFQW